MGGNSVRYGVSLPVRYGTVRIVGVLIWYRAFKAAPQGAV